MLKNLIINIFFTFIQVLPLFLLIIQKVNVPQYFLAKLKPRWFPWHRIEQFSQPRPPFHHHHYNGMPTCNCRTYVYALLENLTEDAIAYSSTCAEILNDFLSI